MPHKIGVASKSPVTGCDGGLQVADSLLSEQGSLMVRGNLRFMSLGFPWPRRAPAAGGALAPLRNTAGIRPHCCQGSGPHTFWGNLLRSPIPWDFRCLLYLLPKSKGIKTQSFCFSGVSFTNTQNGVRLFSLAVPAAANARSLDLVWCLKLSI